MRDASIIARYGSADACATTKAPPRRISAARRTREPALAGLLLRLGLRLVLGGRFYGRVRDRIDPRSLSIERRVRGLPGRKLVARARSWRGFRLRTQRRPNRRIRDRGLAHEEADLLGTLHLLAVAIVDH